MQIFPVQLLTGLACLTKQVYTLEQSKKVLLFYSGEGHAMLLAVVELYSEIFLSLFIIIVLYETHTIQKTTFLHHSPPTTTAFQLSITTKQNPLSLWHKNVEHVLLLNVHTGLLVWCAGAGLAIHFGSLSLNTQLWTDGALVKTLIIFPRLLVSNSYHDHSTLCTTAISANCRERFGMIWLVLLHTYSIPISGETTPQPLQHGISLFLRLGVLYNTLFRPWLEIIHIFWRYAFTKYPFSHIFFSA